MDKVKKHFKMADPVIFELIDRVEPFEFKRTGSYFANLCRSIIGQQLSVKSAQAIFNRFKDLFLKGEISAEHLAKIKDEKLRGVGLSGPKVKYLKGFAKMVSSGEIKFEGIEKLKDEEIILMLTKVSGIGVWTVEMFLMFTLGREDVFSHGDLGLKNAIKKLYKMENPTKEEVEAITIKWSPYRTYGCRILWGSLNLKN